MLAKETKEMRTRSAGRQHTLFYSPWLLWIVWIVWLPFLVPGIVQLSNGSLSAATVLTLAAMAVFVAVYAFFAFRVALALSGRAAKEHDESGTTLLKTSVVVLLLALSVIIELLGRPKGLDPTSLYIYTAAYSGSAFRLPRAVITNAVVLIVCLVTGVLLGFPPSSLLTAVFLVAVVSFMTMSWIRTIVTGRKLHEAQDEIARLAASDERLRIARDLHDLLGQKLSFVALKSELARHLVASAPDRAEAEIAEVESTVRATLQEVREAVAGYRKPELSHELRGAQEILTAAGIQLVNRCDLRLVGRLSAGHSEALAWAVREGVTNVIRHSRAKTCAIDLREDSGAIVVEILDDGNGSEAAATQAKGSGLHGLRERFSALGGTCEAQRRARGGFVLTAAIPTGGKA